MDAFILERLYPTGWRKSGELFWRLSDATRESNRLIREQHARGVRVLPVRIGADAVRELVPDQLSELSGEPGVASCK